MLDVLPLFNLLVDAKVSQNGRRASRDTGRAVHENFVVLVL